MTSNITLSYPNRIDECDITGYTPSDWSSALPLDNLHNKVLSKVARTDVGHKSTTIHLDFLYEPREIGCIAIANHNFTTGAKVRFIGYAENYQTGEVKFDSGLNYRAYPIIHPNDSGRIPFESRNWWLGTVEESQRKDYTSLATFFPASNKMCRSLKIQINDTREISATSSSSNAIGKGIKIFVVAAGLTFTAGQKITVYQATNNQNYMSGMVKSYHSSDGTLFLIVSETGGSGTFSNWEVLNGDHYLEMGRIFLGRTIEPTLNPEYGDLSQGYVDLSEVQRAIDNTKYFYNRPKMRTISGQLKHLNQEEAFSGFYDAQREVGLTGELLYAFSKPEYVGDINMTTDKNFYARTFMCNFSELSPIDMPYINGFATAIKLEEIV